MLMSNYKEQRKVERKYSPSDIKYLSPDSTLFVYNKRKTEDLTSCRSMNQTKEKKPQSTAMLLSD